jgi:hypothetical protein
MSLARQVTRGQPARPARRRKHLPPYIRVRPMKWMCAQPPLVFRRYTVEDNPLGIDRGDGCDATHSNYIDFNVVWLRTDAGGPH